MSVHLLRPNIGCSGAFLKESGKIRKYRRHEVVVTRVGWCETGRIEIEYIKRLGHRFGPRSGGRRENLNFDYALHVTQPLRVGVDMGKPTTDIGCLPRGLAAMLVELDRRLTHRAYSRRCVARRTDRSN